MGDYIKKKPPSVKRRACCYEFLVAQVFNLCSGGGLLSPGGTGFQPVNPLRIIGPQAGTPAPLRA
jgi:hypothetical protein